LAGEEVTLVERVTVSEHFMVVEHVSACPPERPAKPREHAPEFAA